MTSDSLRRNMFRPCGEGALLLDLEDNQLVHRWATAVRDASLPGVLEVVPGLTTLLVTVNTDLTTVASLGRELRGLTPSTAQANDLERHIIYVRYDGEDLAEVSRLTGLSADEVVAAHTGTPWRVAFCGFAPGFSYLVGGDPRLQVPRRDEARIQVPAGAVAIAGAFSSVYPRVSPGGWQLLGHTDAVLWDLGAEPPAVLRPGGVVHFRDVSR